MQGTGALNCILNLVLEYGLPWWLSGKESACQCRRWRRGRFDPWVGKIPWRRKWQPTIVFLAVKFHGQRSLVGYIQSAAAAKSLQSCPTLCDPIDGSPPGSPVPGSLQARTLEWVAISFSNAEKWKLKVKPLSHVRLLATPWTAAYQAPLCMGFSRQEYWNGVPLPSPTYSLWGHKKSDATEHWNWCLGSGERNNNITRKRWMTIEREREREIKQIFPFPMSLKTNMQK